MKKALLFITSLFMLALCSCSNEYNEDFAKQTMLKETTSQNLIEFIFEGKKYSTTYTKVGDSLIFENKEASDILNAAKYSNYYSITFNEDDVVIDKKAFSLSEEPSHMELRGSAASGGRGGNPGSGIVEFKPMIGAVVLFDSYGNNKIFSANGDEGIQERSVMQYGWGDKRVLSFRILNMTDETWIFAYYSEIMYISGTVKVEIPPSSISDIARNSIQGSNGGSQEALLAYLTTEWNRLTHSPFESFRYLPKSKWTEIRWTENEQGRTTGDRGGSSGLPSRR